MRGLRLANGVAASMLGDDYLRKVAGYDFHLLRKKYDVQGMWGDLAPQWRLLKSQLETKGPGWYSPAERGLAKPIFIFMMVPVPCHLQLAGH